LRSKLRIDDCCQFFLTPFLHVGTLLLVFFLVFPNIYAQQEIFNETPILPAGVFPLITDSDGIFRDWDISEKLNRINPYVDNLYVFYDPMNFESFLRTYSFASNKEIHLIFPINISQMITNPSYYYNEIDIILSNEFYNKHIASIIVSYEDDGNSDIVVSTEFLNQELSKIINKFSTEYESVGVYADVKNYENFVGLTDTLVISIFPDKLESNSDSMFLLKQIQDRVYEMNNNTSVKFMIGIQNDDVLDDNMYIASDLLASKKSMDLLNTVSVEYDVIFFTLLSEKYKDNSWNNYGFFKITSENKYHENKYDRRHNDKTTHQLEYNKKETKIIVENNASPKFIFYTNHNDAIIAEIYNKNMLQCDILIYEKGVLREHLLQIDFPYTVVFKSENNFERDGLKISNCKMEKSIVPVASAQETILLESGSFEIRISSGDLFKETTCDINPYCHVSHIIEPVTSDKIFSFTIPKYFVEIINLLIATLPLLMRVGYKIWQKSKTKIYSISSSMTTITYLQEPYTKNKNIHKLEFLDAIAIAISVMYILVQIIYKGMF